MAALESCHVYVIGATSDGPVKVGVAKNVRSRLKSLQTGAHTKLEILHAMPMDRLAAFDVEHIAHRLLAAKRLSGEWFDVSAAEAATAIERATVLGVRDPEDRRSKRDGLASAESLGWVVGPQMEAALAYRELREYAMTEMTAGACVSATHRNARMPKRVDARLKLDKIDRLVLAKTGRGGLGVLVGVAANGVSIDRFAATEEAWETKASLLGFALDVVVEELNRTISA